MATGVHATALADVRPGSTVVVIGDAHDPATVEFVQDHLYRLFRHNIALHAE